VSERIKGSLKFPPKWKFDEWGFDIGDLDELLQKAIQKGVQSAFEEMKEIDAIYSTLELKNGKPIITVEFEFQPASPEANPHYELPLSKMIDWASDCLKPEDKERLAKIMRGYADRLDPKGTAS
jgi:hypothetical protein